MYGRRPLQRDVSQWSAIAEQHQQRKSQLLAEHQAHGGCDGVGANGSETEKENVEAELAAPPSPPRSLTRRRIQAPPPPPRSSPVQSAECQVAASKPSRVEALLVQVQPSALQSSGNAFSVLMSSSSHNSSGASQQRKRKAESSLGVASKSQRPGGSGAAGSGGGGSRGGGGAGGAEASRTPQLFLDFGQTLKGLSTCADCGFVYQSGLASDEAMHRQTHELRVKGIAFNGWQEEPPNLLSLLPQSASTAAHSADRLLRIDASHLAALPSHSAKVGEILARLNQQLGSSSSSDSGDSSPISSGTPTSSSPLLPAHLSLYFYVRHKRVIAAMTVRSDVEASPLVPSPSSHGSYQLSLLDRRSAAIGVEQVWVVERHRRGGVASRMLDACRLSHVYVSQDRRDVAFSQPTSQGRQFAQHYTGQADFLAYG